MEEENEDEKPIELKSELELQIELENEREDDVKKSKKAIDYGKISTAINKMKQFGVNVRPPDINNSAFTFKPEESTNSIIYGLKGISQVNTEFVNRVIRARPFTSFEDFKSKVKATKLQSINLIKAGAFDTIEPDREKLLFSYIKSEANLKKRLTLQNMPSLIKYSVIPEKYEDVVKVFNFVKFLKKECKVGAYYILDDYSRDFFASEFDADLLIVDGEKTLIEQKQMEKLYKKKMEEIRPFLSEPSSLDSLNNALIDELWQKYCKGNKSTWEMDSIGFYNGAHELDLFDFSSYPIVNYFSMPEEPLIEKTFTSKDGNSIPIYRLNAIVGTVIGKNKLKNTVTLLTKEGVVPVKVYKTQFAKYDKQKYEKDEETGKKTVTEKSWFTRGNKLIFIGIRRGDTWVPKKYKSSPWASPIILVKDLDFEKGTYSIVEGRED